MVQSRSPHLAHQAARGREVAEGLRRVHRRRRGLLLELPHRIQELPGRHGAVPGRQRQGRRQVRGRGQDQAALRRLPRRHHGLCRHHHLGQGAQGDGQPGLFRDAGRQRPVPDRQQARHRDHPGEESRLLAAGLSQARQDRLSRHPQFDDAAAGAGQERARLRHAPRSQGAGPGAQEHQLHRQLDARLGVGLPAVQPQGKARRAVAEQAGAPGDLLRHRPRGDRRTRSTTARRWPPTTRSRPATWAIAARC